MSKCTPDIKDGPLTKEKTEEEQQGNKKEVIEEEPQNPENKHLDAEKKIITGTLTKVETNDNKESSTSSSDIESKLLQCKESVQNSDSKLEENVACGETNCLASPDVSKQEESACSSKKPLSQDVKKQDSKTKIKPKKKLLSPSSNSEKNTLSKFVALTVGKNSNINDVIIEKEQTEESKENNVDKREGKVLGSNTGSASAEKSPERICQFSADDSLFKTPSMVNNSLEISTESESNTTPSTPDTPTSSKKSASKTPRKMTPNQLKKLKEKEEQRMEKERLKQVSSSFL